VSLKLCTAWILQGRKVIEFAMKTKGFSPFIADELTRISHTAASFRRGRSNRRLSGGSEKGL